MDKEIRNKEANHSWEPDARHSITGSQCESESQWSLIFFSLLEDQTGQIFGKNEKLRIDDLSRTFKINVWCNWSLYNTYMYSRAGRSRLSGKSLSALII